MKILDSYIAKTCLVNVAVAVAVATFIFLIGHFARMFELLAQGVSIRSFFTFIFYRLPQAFSFTLPLGLYISAVLMLNKMSANNEITAMRASGLSLLQLIAPAIVVGFCFTCLCMLLQFIWSPEYVFQSKWLVRTETVKNPLQLIEVGRFVEIFDGYVLYVREKEESNVRDVHLYLLDQHGRVQQKIDARQGAIQADPSLLRLNLTLYNATIESMDADNPIDVSKMQRIKGESISFPLDYGESLYRRPLVRRISEMKISQLLANIRIQQERGVDTVPLYVELHLRAALAISPFSLLLIAIPLGIRKPRSESSWILLVSVSIPFLYFASTSFLESMHHNVNYKPELWLWLPNIVTQGIGLITLWQRR